MNFDNGSQKSDLGKKSIFWNAWKMYKSLRFSIIKKIEIQIWKKILRHFIVFLVSSSVECIFLSFCFVVVWKISVGFQKNEGYLSKGIICEHLMNHCRLISYWLCMCLINITPSVNTFCWNLSRSRNLYLSHTHHRQIC